MFELLSVRESALYSLWNLESLGQLEWHRFQELVARLLRRAGYLPEVAWIRPDGATALTLAHPSVPANWRLWCSARLGCGPPWISPPCMICIKSR